jgi:hypothetical protein
METDPPVAAGVDDELADLNEVGIIGRGHRVRSPGRYQVCGQGIELRCECPLSARLP